MWKPVLQAMCKLRAAPLWLWVLGVACVAVPGGASAAERPHRIVSINACTDQLLFKLADREQIAALTHYAADPDFSVYASEVRASGIPLIQGNAEEVLHLKPDLVIAGKWTRTATRALLTARGLPIADFAPDESVAASIVAIEEIAKLVGHGDRGAAMIAEIEAALATTAAEPAAKGTISVLEVQRRGYTSGHETLTGELLRRLGLANAADQLGIANVGHVTLEALLKARPDALIVMQPGADASDQGVALLRHPALMAAYPSERRILLPAQLTACGGPALAQAVRMLGEGARRIPRSGK